MSMVRLTTLTMASESSVRSGEGWKQGKRTVKVGLVYESSIELPLTWKCA